MNIEQEIQEAFFTDGAVPITSEFILKNPDLMWLKNKEDLLVLVPSYILWCTRNRDSNGNLVIDGTINALAEYGRSKKEEIEHLNFKFSCKPNQREVVYSFLKWCLDEELLVDEEQIERAIKHWG